MPRPVAATRGSLLSAAFLRTDRPLIPCRLPGSRRRPSAQKTPPSAVASSNICASPRYRCSEHLRSQPLSTRQLVWCPHSLAAYAAARRLIQLALALAIPEFRRDPVKERKPMADSRPTPKNFLLLIENSTALSPFWPQLRKICLPQLVSQLRGFHPAHMTNIFILESRPRAQDLLGDTPRQYGSIEVGLKDVQFSYEPDNRLSIAQIRAGIEFLSSAGASGARHLVVVAANSPVAFGTYDSSSLSDDPWIELAKQLAAEDVHLHLALTSNLRSGPLTNLFEQALEWQQNTEEPLWLATYPADLLFRVSVVSHYPNFAFPVSCDETEIIGRADGAPPASAKTKSTCAARKSPREDVSLDMYSTKSLDDNTATATDTDAALSLVTRLQQVHGLTKKKVYGAKSTGVPFIMDERARGHRKAPASLLAAADARASPPGICNVRPRPGGTPGLRPLLAGDHPCPPHPARWQQPPARAERHAASRAPYGLPSPVAAGDGFLSSPPTDARFAMMPLGAASAYYPPFSCTPLAGSGRQGSGERASDVPPQGPGASPHAPMMHDAAAVDFASILAPWEALSLSLAAESPPPFPLTPVDGPAYPFYPDGTYVRTNAVALHDGPPTSGSVYGPPAVVRDAPKLFAPSPRRIVEPTPPILRAPPIVGPALHRDAAAAAAGSGWQSQSQSQRLAPHSAIAHLGWQSTRLDLSSGSAAAYAASAAGPDARGSGSGAFSSSSSLMGWSG